MKRRSFLKGVAAATAVTGVTKTGWTIPAGENYELEKNTAPTDILSACPYCGVGCGTIIKTENEFKIYLRAERNWLTLLSADGQTEPEVLAETNVVEVDRYVALEGEHI